MGPNNAVLDEDDDDGGGDNARISFTLPSAGMYTVEATSFAPSGRGTYALKLEPDCPPVPISFDTPMPINGALSNEDCNAPHRAGRRADLYTFTVNARQRVTITMNSTAFDAYLILVGANNRVIASNDDYGGSNNARISDFTLPGAGTYTIEATAVAINERGAYTLTLFDAECRPVLPITPDTLVNGSLTDRDCAAPHRAGRRADLYTFTGAAGQRVTITMNSTAFDSYLILVGPDNRRVTSNNDWNREKNARINNLLLRSNGVYAIEATAFGSAERGAYTLRFSLPRTIFLVHGIRQSTVHMRSLATTLQDARYGIDTARFKVDSGFNYSDCALNTRCNSSRCVIPEIAKRLADYINRQNPQGEIIVIGYSLGGLVARDMMLNNYSNVFANRRVAALITLGTPNAGYPYLPADDLAACRTLLQQMGSNFRQPSSTVAMSEYLVDLNTRWGASSYPGRPQVWLAVAGTFCPGAERFPPGSGTGCSDVEPWNDGVVCSQSALLRINVGNRPTQTWASNSYAHTDKSWSSDSVNVNKSLFSECLFGGNTHPLFNPPAEGDLVRKIKEVINGLAFTSGGALGPESVDLSSRREPFPVSQASDDEALGFLRSALDRQLPDETKDDIYLLARARSALMLPAIARHIAQFLPAAETLPDYIYSLADVIAYAADERAVDQLLRLAELKPEQFGPYLARLLNYTHGKRNPYQLVYCALPSADPMTASYLLEWVEENATSTQGQWDWAEAIVEMGAGATPEEILANDPILSRMPDEKLSSLRKSLASLAQEVIRQRKD